MRTDISNLIQSLKQAHIVKKLNLGTSGLSSSDVQAITNLMTQRVRQIDLLLIGLNNASKTMDFNNKTWVKQPARPLPVNIVELLTEKGNLNGAIGYLRENVKGKELLLSNILLTMYDDYPTVPLEPEYYTFKTESMVDEEWGFEQLTVNEVAEYWQHEALAAHYGQFIHKGGVLDQLRTELPHIPTLEWEQVRSGTGYDSIPIEIKAHHTVESLLQLHTDIAALHRNSEKIVNRYKAKVKTAVTNENIARVKRNQDEHVRVTGLNKQLADDYNVWMTQYRKEYATVENRHSQEQYEEKLKVHALKVKVHENFKNIIDVFADKLK